MKKRMMKKSFFGFVSLVLPVLVLVLAPSRPAPAIEGDLTGDDFVNFRDVALLAANWLEADPPPPLYVYEVTSSGIDPCSAQDLASELGISPGDLDANDLYDFGVASYINPSNFQAVNMDPINPDDLDPNFTNDPCANEDGEPTLHEGFNFTDINNIVPYPDDNAFNNFNDAMGEVGLSLQSLQNPEHVIIHSLFSAVDVNNDPIIEDKEIDTHLVYNFSLGGGGTPFLGPGAQVSVSFAGDGSVTHLHYSQRELSQGSDVDLITRSDAMERFVSSFPEFDDIEPGYPELVYYAPSLSNTTVGVIVPHYDCTGTATVTGCDVVSLQALIPATDDTNFVPDVNLVVSADVNYIDANVFVTGGGGTPITYTWSSSTTDLSDFNDANNIGYAIQPRAGTGTVTSEIVCVTVTDRNGIQVKKCKTVTVTVEACSSGGAVGPLGANDTFGTERGVSGTLGASNQKWFDWRMRPPLGCATRSFYWSGMSAWERDFKDPACHSGGLDRSYVDNVDLTFYIGHGWPGGFTFVNTNQNDTWLTCADASRYCRCATRGGWGNKDLEWLALLSCNVLQHTYRGDRYDRRWGPAFNGLHLLLGFHTVAYDSPGFGFTFADQMMGRPWRAAVPIRVAWFRAKAWRQPASTKAAVMGVYGPGYINNYNDYFWCTVGPGGSVGPDIRCPWIRGYWWVSY